MRHKWCTGTCQKISLIQKQLECVVIKWQGNVSCHAQCHHVVRPILSIKMAPGTQLEVCRPRNTNSSADACCTKSNISQTMCEYIGGFPKSNHVISVYLTSSLCLCRLLFLLAYLSYFGKNKNPDVYTDGRTDGRMDAYECTHNTKYNGWFLFVLERAIKLG